MSGTSWTDAPEVARVALAIIGEVDEYSPLRNVEVRYLWRHGKVPERGGRVTLAKMGKVTGMQARLANALDPDLGFYVMWVSAEAWDHLEPEQRVAVVDHELSHCEVQWVERDGEERIQLGIVAHDIEDFRAVWRRHGDWRSDLGSFGDLLDQVAGQQRMRLDHVDTEREPTDEERAERAAHARMADAIAAAEARPAR